jgi:hypothetical protein
VKTNNKAKASSNTSVFAKRLVTLTEIFFAFAAVGNAAPKKVLLVSQSPKVRSAIATVQDVFTETPMALTEGRFV